MAGKFLSSSNDKIIWAVGSLMFVAAVIVLMALVFANNSSSRISEAYGVTVVERQTNLSGPNKLIIEKDNQRLTCDVPSPEEIGNKTSLSCTDAKSVQRVEAS